MMGYSTPWDKLPASHILLTNSVLRGKMRMMRKDDRLSIFKLALAILICEGAGILGSLATAPSISSWYNTLARPSFSPPNWIFAPVWTSLYLLMGVSLYLVWRKKGNLNWFWVQLGLNVVWSFLFFGFRSPAWAFVEIIALWFSILLTIRSFKKVDITAAWLLVPYLCWVSFASILNLAIWVLN